MMHRHFMMYWRYEQMLKRLNDALTFNYSGSNQYSRLQKNDEIWFVTQSPKYSLLLFGHIKVDLVVPQAEILNYPHIFPTQVWKADYYVGSHTPELFTLIDLSSVAADLRFNSSTKDRLTFTIAGQVVTQSLQTMRQITEASINLLQGIWQTEELDTGINSPFDVDTPQTYKEGKRKLRLHYHYERNSALISEAKRQFKIQHGKLYCEVCGFDFEKQYGKLGENFIEAHHRIPLSEIKEDTHSVIHDLAMVCSNCHRMLHRRKPWLTIDDLKILLK